MAICNVTYSPEIARRAVRAYFWRKRLTRLGALHLLSLAAAIGIVALVYRLRGPDWFVGAFGLLIAINVIGQLVLYFSMPGAYAKHYADPTNRTGTVETSQDGVRVTVGANSNLLPWKKYKYVWVYPEFVLLSISPMSSFFNFIPTAGMTPEVQDDLVRAQNRRSSK